MNNPLFRAFVVACVALGCLSCNTGRTMNGEWAVSITTEGGFAGRGMGSVALSSAEAAGSPANDRVASAVAAAVPERWQSEYRVAGNPHGYADQILYKLSLTRAGKTYSTSWYDDSRDQLPRDLGALFDVVWSKR